MMKIMVITGTRADYGIYYPILKKIQQESTLELHLLVTGMHLSPQYGHTVKYIIEDGFQISARVDCLLQGSTHANMARAIALAIQGMSQAFEMIQPDRILILGDRGEMLAAAITASHMNIPIFHLHGGEVSGTIDESVRHAISKLSHIHFVATLGSEQRLIRMGEDDWRVYVTGAPRIETILKEKLPSINEVKAKYNLNQIGQYILFIYHPVTTESSNLCELKRIMDTLFESKWDVILVMPNADAGTENIIEIYEEYNHRERMYQMTSFQQMDYLTILKHADALVGNSSSGIIEAASFHIPVINIGNRQGKRERSANVIDINENADELQEALAKIQTDEFRKIVDNVENVYYHPDTCNRIMELLMKDYPNEELTQKTISY